jgi:hypothetical protein
MSKWDFRKEPNGNEPFYNADVEASKRNVIATEKGWVRRITYTDTHGNERTKDEIVVAANPAVTGAFDGYANSAFLGFPDVSVITLSDGPYTVGAEMFINISFNEAISNTTVSLITPEILVTNNEGSTTHTALGNTSITEADNTLTFRFTPDKAGTFQIGAQTLGSDPGFVAVAGGEAANLEIDATTAAALGTFTVS